MARLLVYLAICVSLLEVVYGASRTTPPAGAKVVRAGTTTSGEFGTLSAAVSSLPNDSSSQVIFIFPGTYSEQVYITRTGPLTIYGYTTDTTTYKSNQATIQAGVDATQAGSDDASGTLRVHKNDFKMYNVNVKNTFGVGSQAIALSQYGSRVGLYACGFYGYQDTLYANVGTQVYLRNYIEGAVDFIFGRQGLAYFGGNTIGVKGAGYVTANGRESNDSGSYVFNANTIVTASGASSNVTARTYFGRPWGNFAKVIFKNTVVTAPFNSALWSQWNVGDPRTDNILFAEFNSSGSGVSGASRPSFATVLSASQASAYSISSAVGSDYTSWVDMSYFI
ncbi:carbohydrate esterase family 8 protein [Macrolepiota fuliginosa MF-IS2]|uniref:Pectinesterase n=1 Tax=Macrolepiota fuliginosa MF-IS2 TaxID=1400762 RepID=A0A9P5XI45_9AGAR|nr:carbohydrate esterase family 8 protein [Macrolepiota fuliginosa MF-IS2]